MSFRSSQSHVHKQPDNMQMLTPEGHYQLSCRTEMHHASMWPSTAVPRSRDQNMAGKWNTGQLYREINVQKAVSHLLSTELILWTENAPMIHYSTQEHTKLQRAILVSGTTSGD